MQSSNLLEESSKLNTGDVKSPAVIGLKDYGTKDS